MALFRTGLYVKNHSVEKVQVASTPIASFNGNVTGLYIPELIAYIMAKQSGSGTPSPDNIRPISGWSECNVVRCGKNILKTNGLTFANPSSTATANTTPRKWTFNSYCVGVSHNNYYFPTPVQDYSISNNEIMVKSASPAYGVNIPITLSSGISGKITVNGTVTGGSINVGFYGADGKFISSNESSILPRGINIPTGTLWAVLSFVPSTSVNPPSEVTFTDIMVELSDSSSSYEPYTGNTYTIQLGDTYYGGSLDVTTGVLTCDYKFMRVTSVYVASGKSANFTVDPPSSGYTLATNPFLCNMLKPSGYSTAYDNHIHFANTAVVAMYMSEDIGDKTAWNTWLSNNEVDICYKLATPITVQLTPTQIEQLLGANNVWCDTGDVEVKFYNVVR